MPRPSNRALKNQVRVLEQSLRGTVAAIFSVMGESTEDADLAADVLVGADLRGADSHGVNALSDYVDQYRDGRLKPRAAWRIVRESPGTATIDGDRGHGIILGPKAMGLAIGKARKVGLAAVTMFNCGHSAAVGQYAMQAARENMIGVCMTSSAMPAVVPTFGAEPRFGTNPLAIAAPARHQAPYLFDAATSTVSGGKIQVYSRDCSVMPAGWLSDDRGTPITHEGPFPEQGSFFYLPLGSTREQGSHKGDGLGMMTEIMSSLLSGSLPSVVDGKFVPKHYFSAFNVEAFTDLEAFKDNMDRVLRTLKNTRPAPGRERVTYAGLAGHEKELERRANGIPLQDEVLRWFESAATELGVPALDTV